MKNTPEYERLCVYCEHAAPTYEPDRMMCDKNGIVSVSYRCRKFVYDPLKRIPRPKRSLPEVDVVLIDDE